MTSTLSLDVDSAAAEMDRLAAPSSCNWPREHHPQFCWSTFRPNRNQNDAVLAFCYVGSTLSAGSGNAHTCVLSVRRNPGDRTPVIAYHCGDTALTGKMPKSTYDEGLTSATSRARLESQASGVMATYRKYDRIVESAKRSYGTQPTNTGCNFWQVINSGKVCKHLQSFFDQIPEWNNGMSRKAFLTAMSEEYRQWMGP